MTPSPATLLVSFLVVLGICAAGAIIYLAIIVSRRQSRQMDDFMARFGLPVVDMGQTESITEGSVTYHYQILPLGRGKKPQLSVWYEHANKGHLKVRREMWIDRLFKRLGIVAEVQTNDPIFDESYFIDTAEPRFGRALLARDVTRDAIQTLMNMGFDSVALEDDRITAKLTDALREPPASVGQALRALHELSKHQPKLPDHLGRDVRTLWRARISAIYTFLCIILVLGAGTIYWGFEHYRPLDTTAVFLHSLPFSCTIFGVSLLLLVLGLRGHSSSHLHIAFCGSLSLIAYLVLCDGLTIYANGYADVSPVNTYRVAIQKKWSRTNRGNTAYRVRVDSWHAEKAHQDLVIDKTLFKNINVSREQLIVTTRSGKLGYEWLSAPFVVIPL